MNAHQIYEAHTQTFDVRKYWIMKKQPEVTEILRRYQLYRDMTMSLMRPT